MASVFFSEKSYAGTTPLYFRNEWLKFKFHVFETFQKLAWKCSWQSGGNTAEITEICWVLPTSCFSAFLWQAHTLCLSVPALPLLHAHMCMQLFSALKYSSFHAYSPVFARYFCLSGVLISHFVLVFRLDNDRHWLSFPATIPTKEKNKVKENAWHRIYEQLGFIKYQRCFVFVTIVAN